MLFIWLLSATVNGVQEPELRCRSSNWLRVGRTIEGSEFEPRLGQDISPVPSAKLALEPTQVPV
jgi:hypothetical protein